MNSYIKLSEKYIFLETVNLKSYITLKKYFFSWLRNFSTEKSK